jgi:hypothetical protein
MIEQATKVLNAVHKRMHAAQAEEFQLLARCFKENPESFWQRKGKPSYPWDEHNFVQALNDCELIPQADPNTSSQTQRLMKIMALKQLAAANPSMYDPIAIDTAALKAIGWSNPEQFLAPQSAQANPPPELIQAQAMMKVNDMKAQASMMDAQTKAQAMQMKGHADLMKAKVDLIRAQNEIDIAEQQLREKSADRIARERIQLVDLAQNLAVHPMSAGLVEPLIQPTVQDINREEQIGMQGLSPRQIPGGE